MSAPTSSTRTDRIVAVLVRRLGIPGALDLLREIAAIPGAPQPRFPHPRTARAKVFRTELRRLVRAGMPTPQIVRTLRYLGYQKSYALEVLRRLNLRDLHPVRTRAWHTRRRRAAKAL